MDVMNINYKEKGGNKGNLIIKTWKRCKSIGRSSSSNGRRVAPVGCFSVYVGPEKQRFVIKTEYVNHPLFKLLLEEAESEYGFHSDGPLVLPCKVDVFYLVLLAIEEDSLKLNYYDDDDHHNYNIRRQRQGCGFAAAFSPNNASSYRLLITTPALLP